MKLYVVSSVYTYDFDYEIDDCTCKAFKTLPEAQKEMNGIVDRYLEHKSFDDRLMIEEREEMCCTLTDEDEGSAYNLRVWIREIEVI